MAKVNAVLLFFQLISVFILSRGDVSTYNVYQTPEKILANGYPAERHHVITEDGYVLELHRIPIGKAQSPIVFLMHGIFATSKSFIALGPEYGVAYNYADAGFDVWMGNARGTRNSRNHTSLNPDDSKQRFKFFNFSFEEIGIYDISASIDYILNLTGRDKLHFIGHSQGGTAFLVLNSLKPEYNNKFKSAHLLAGVGYQDHFPNGYLKRLAKYTDVIYTMSVGLGIVELFPPTSNNVRQLAEVNDPSELCAGHIKLKNVCSRIGMQEIMNVINQNIELEGASIKQVAHFGQNVRDKAFRRWDYGPIKNMQIYGRLTPPTYNLRLVTANVTMHYTVADGTLDERDVIAMSKDMANANVRKVDKETFKHNNFVNSKDAKELVTEFIIYAISTSESS